MNVTAHTVVGRGATCYVTPDLSYDREGAGGSGAKMMDGMKQLQ